MQRACFACAIALAVTRVASSAAEHSSAAGGGVDAARVGEARWLADAAIAVVDSLPQGEHARDELRGFHGKITSLINAADVTAPSEWDAMLSALLKAKYYGIDDLLALLSSHDPSHRASAAASTSRTAEQASCESESEKVSSENGPRHARRLQQQQKAQPPLFTHASSDSQTSTAQLPELSSSIAWLFTGWIGGQFWMFRRWLLDRPPPWERDCDCCFQQCPEGYNCLLQGDGLYLACRGESLGAIVEGLFLDRYAESTRSVVARA